MTTPWVSHRRRAEFLRDGQPFAAEILTLYLGLLDVWDRGWELAREQQPEPDRLAAWAAERVLPPVVKVTEAAGPELLGKAARDLFEAGGLQESLDGWLAGAGLPPVERFLARASLQPPLVALGEDVGKACTSASEASASGAVCPRCGGPPQLSYRSDARDQLVSGRRFLLCARCGHGWGYSQSTCPSCGETTGSQRTVYAEQRTGPVVGRTVEKTEDEPTFPHLRIDACASCQRYLIDVDLGRDGRAVPEVDELAALPLDLYAVERGLSKITPNLMGF
jgi:FdhE protein